MKTNFDKIKPEYVYLDTTNGDITITLPVGFTFTEEYDDVCIDDDPITVVISDGFYQDNFIRGEENYDFDEVYYSERRHLQDIVDNMTEEDKEEDMTEDGDQLQTDDGFTSRLQYNISQTLDVDKIDHIKEITKNLNKSKMKYITLFTKNKTTQGGKRIYQK